MGKVLVKPAHLTPKQFIHLVAELDLTVTTSARKQSTDGVRVESSIEERTYLPHDPCGFITVRPIAVRCSRRHEKATLLVVTQRARARPRQFGQLADGHAWPGVDLDTSVTV